MGRRKVDRSDKVMQTFEATKVLKQRLETAAARHNMTVSALIRSVLERALEDRAI